MDGLACPCGLREGYASCCGRLHAGAPAPTAESLMRSRYSAFAVGDAGYLLRTWHPSRRPRTLSLDPALRWTRLAVLETRDGGLFDATGTVQFRAMYVRQEQRGVLAETSRFVRHNRHWTYLGPIDRRAPSFPAITLKVPGWTTQENGSLPNLTRPRPKT
jgi:SEC-C motif-containing protein